MDITGQKTVVLCGSVNRAASAMRMAKQYYEDRGYLVHMPVKDDTTPVEQHTARWLALIDACGPDDLVVICSEPDEHYGQHTLQEWNHALARSKRVRHWTDGGAPEAALPTSAAHRNPGAPVPEAPSPSATMVGDRP